MPTVRFSAEEARRNARVDRTRLGSTTEADIARHAQQDDARPLTEDEVGAMLDDGRAMAMAPVDVAAIRAKSGLSQERFAEVFGISLSTLRNWEQGRRAPEGPARVLLRVIDHEPEAVRRALAAG
jgi:putative transcriptional regulator